MIKWSQLYLTFILSICISCNLDKTNNEGVESESYQINGDSIEIFEAYFAQYNWNKAFDLSEKLIEEDNLLTKDLILKMTEVSLQVHEYEKGLKAISKIDSIDYVLSPNEKIKRDNLKSIIYRKLNRQDLADSLALLALNANKLKSLGDSILWVESSLSNIDRKELSNNSPQKAIELTILDSLTIQIEKSIPSLKWDILILLSNTYNFLRNYSKADSYLNRARKILRDNFQEDYRKVVSLNSAMLVNYLFSGQVKRADSLVKELEYYHNNYSLPAATKASFYFHKAMVLGAQGNNSGAIESYEKSLREYEIMQQKRHRNTINFIKHNLGVKYIDKGNLPKARALFSELEKDYAEMAIEDLILANTLFNLGRLESLLPEPEGEKVETYFRKSLRIYDTKLGKKSRNSILPLHYLTKEKVRKGNFFEANEVLNEVIDVAEKSLNPQDVYWANIFREKANLLLKLGDLDEAIITIDKGSNILRHGLIDIYKLELLLTKSKLFYWNFKRTPNVKNADALFGVIDSLDKTYESVKSKIIEQKDAFGHLDKIKIAIENTIEVLYQVKESDGNLFFNKYQNKAWRFFELVKSNTLLDLVAKSKLTNESFDLMDSYSEKEEYLWKKRAYFRNRLEQKSEKDPIGSEQIDDFKDSLFYYNRLYEALMKEQKSINPTLYAIKYNKPISIDSLQTTLSPAETVLEYFLTDSALYAFAINSFDISFQKLSLPRDFDEKLEGFLFNSKATSKEDEDLKRNYAETANEFFNVLVRPLLDTLKEGSHENNKKLIIIPDGKLGYLPWDALLTDKPEDIYDYRSYPFMLKQHSIRYAYSANLMKLLEEKQIGDKELMAAFAPGYISKGKLVQAFKSIEGETCMVPDEADFVELSQSSQELDEILANIDGNRFDLLNASEARFKEIANQYRILHLTMHGFTDDCDPMYSGLAFTPRSMLEASGISDTTNPTNEGILHAYEIYNMRLNAELVVMSACQTGLGKIQAGEGIMSLARAFAHAGTPNTVMSLWQVEEAATRRLMSSFYKYLAQGMGKDEALQFAKLDYIKEHEEAHPYYWAGFTLIGDDKPIVEDNWFQKNWWKLALGLALLLGIYAVLRKYSSSART